MINQTDKNQPGCDEDIQVIDQKVLLLAAKQQQRDQWRR